ncbi:unnamed protein product [Spirodela intermedia]|uniref:Uncharacterized protein n=1 Tax=Spirodela intermedia TaxID=51605 RepID=A0A7I8JN91_SPIIN|nr:unnamed protein product [Spirodela intermedia]CAA6671634.1 unnamed protein product [Spirodela intermedia]
MRTLLSPVLQSLRRRSPSVVSILRRSMTGGGASGASSLPPLTPATTRVGWIGTGVMGRYMAGHLISAGYALTVFNRTPSKAQPLVEMGAKLAGSPRGVAEESDVVFLIVGYPSDVRRVVLDQDEGVLGGLSPGSVVVDMTTSDPSMAEEIYASARSASCRSVDAPVSGGTGGLATGSSRSSPAGTSPPSNGCHRCSGAWDGELHGRTWCWPAAKLGNQIAIASTMVGLVEGMLFAHKAGLDVRRWMEAISTGAAGSKSLTLYGDRILQRDMAAGFFVHHFVKDLGICLKECQSMGLALPGLALAQQLYLSLVAHGEGNLGTQALILAIERLNNTQL